MLIVQMWVGPEHPLCAEYMAAVRQFAEEHSAAYLCVDEDGFRDRFDGIWPDIERAVGRAVNSNPPFTFNRQIALSEAARLCWAATELDAFWLDSDAKLLKMPTFDRAGPYMAESRPGRFNYCVLYCNGATEYWKELRDRFFEEPAIRRETLYRLIHSRLVCPEIALNAIPSDCYVHAGMAKWQR